ncbi:glycosyltransferase [Christiangramia flava]|uniref:Glycosyltransferase 2-like domain-containing protein n=1 Tax=Christiangramia flava JLT2011 TaxID=1229726 RepID=A0A1L7I691_9FLAO|nr:glycosyltransferase [Christiangramia flava]APU69096.1 hypothetical protein GRFL_2372 [Christiangramia flava JLT2011]
MSFITIKKKILENWIKIKFRLHLNFYRRFNTLIKDQYKDFRRIPILIISFNQLHYLKGLIDFLDKHDYRNIIIIDNNSTYKPLREYLASIEHRITVYRLPENYGHNVVFKRKDLFDKYLKGYYVITDSDVVPIKECPPDFLKFFKDILDQNSKVRKVGFGLKIDDIPDSNPQKHNILKRQSKFWDKDKKTAEGYYAEIDTTFALYRPKSFNFLPVPYFSGIRTTFPYLAHHGGWYIDPKKLTSEQEYYLKTSNNSGSWKLNDDGSLENKKFPGLK